MHQPETIKQGTSRPGDAIGYRKVLVAIPARNMEVTIGSRVLRVRMYADHVIVIDYGSTDNTTEVAMLAGATVITGRRNEQNGKGIRDAFTFARQAGADVLVLLDGDALDRMEEIPLQIRPILEDKADFVNGWPPVEKKGTGNRKPHYLRRIRDALALATNPARRRKAVTRQNGFRAFSRKMFDCFTFSQVSVAGDTEAPEITEAKMKRKQVSFYGDSGLDRPALDPFSVSTGGFNGLAGRLSGKSPSRLFCVLGFGMILLGAGCIFMLMNQFNATHNLGVEYGIGSMVFILPGLVLFYNGVLLRSMRASAKERANRIDNFRGKPR